MRVTKVNSSNELRKLRNAPGFDVVVILSLPVGVGASSALGFLVDAAVLRFPTTFWWLRYLSQRV